MNTFNRILVTAAACVGCSVVAQAADPAKGGVREQAIEASASSVVLPATRSGTLVVTPCTGCAPRSLLVTPRTVYLASNGTVQLAALRKTFVAKPRTYLTVLYDPDTQVVTRVIADVAVLPEKSKP